MTDDDDLFIFSLAHCHSVWTLCSVCRHVCVYERAAYVHVCLFGTCFRFNEISHQCGMMVFGIMDIVCIYNYTQQRPIHNNNAVFLLFIYLRGAMYGFQIIRNKKCQEQKKIIENTIALRTLQI